jgi:CheY-like chemotaxis protein
MTESEAPATILVVEDNPANLLLAEEILKLAGYRTIGASSAEQAQGSIEKQMPDLILLDIRMPGMDGLKFVRMLRSSPITERLPIIALTAQAMADEQAAGIAAGFDAYLVKPIQQALLLEAVGRALTHCA